MTYRILSLDGGGIRGVVPAVILSEVEKQIGQPLNQYFDLIAGTSTGSILAAAVATGKKSSEILELYRQKGKIIFPYTSLFSYKRLPLLFKYGLSAPKYSDKGLLEVLKEQFGNRKLSEVNSTKLLITAYDTLSRKPLIFKSWRRDKPYENVPLWEACACSASAPTFFPAHLLKPKEKGKARGGSAKTIALAKSASRTKDDYNNMRIEIVSGTGSGQINTIADYDGITHVATVEKEWETVPDNTSEYAVAIEYSVIDGGVGANNPSACALAEGIRLLREAAENALFKLSPGTVKVKDLIEEIAVLSIGTGEVSRSNQSEDPRSWGLVDWVLTGRLIGVLFDASSGVDDYITNQVMSVPRDGESSRYLRLQPKIGSDRIDDAGSENVNRLMRYAWDYMENNKDLLTDFLKNS